MRRKIRNKTYREQQLQRVALAAGASFGCPESQERLSGAASRTAGYMLHAMVLAPVVTSAAWYFTS